MKKGKLWARPVSGSPASEALYNVIRAARTKSPQLIFKEIDIALSALPQDILYSLLYCRECNKPIYYPKNWLGQLQTCKCNGDFTQNDLYELVINRYDDNMLDGKVYFIIDDLHAKVKEYLQAIDKLNSEEYDLEHVREMRSELNKKIFRTALKAIRLVTQRADASGLLNIARGEEEENYRF